MLKESRFSSLRNLESTHRWYCGRSPSVGIVHARPRPRTLFPPQGEDDAFSISRSLPLICLPLPLSTIGPSDGRGRGLGRRDYGLVGGSGRGLRGDAASYANAAVDGRARDHVGEPSRREFLMGGGKSGRPLLCSFSHFALHSHSLCCLEDFVCMFALAFLSLSVVQ